MEAITRNIIQQDWITVVLLLSLVVLTVVKKVSTTAFIDFTTLVFTNKFVVLYQKEISLTGFFTVSLLVVRAINIALFLWFFIQGVYPDLFTTEYLYAILLGYVIAFTILRVLIQKIIGVIFMIEQEMDRFIFQKLTYANLNGLFLTFINILLAYSLVKTPVILYIAAFVIILTNLAGWFSVCKNYQKEILANIFYFILYLCALEIAPYLLSIQLLR